MAKLPTAPDANTEPRLTLVPKYSEPDPELIAAERRAERDDDLRRANECEARSDAYGAEFWHRSVRIHDTISEARALVSGRREMSRPALRIVP